MTRPCDGRQTLRIAPHRLDFRLGMTYANFVTPILSRASVAGHVDFGYSGNGAQMAADLVKARGRARKPTT